VRKGDNEDHSSREVHIETWWVGGLDVIKILDKLLTFPSDVE